MSDVIFLVVVVLIGLMTIYSLIRQMRFSVGILDITRTCISESQQLIGKLSEEAIKAVDRDSRDAMIGMATAHAYEQGKKDGMDFGYTMGYADAAMEIDAIVDSEVDDAIDSHDQLPPEQAVRAGFQRVISRVGEVAAKANDRKEAMLAEGDDDE